VKSIEFEIKSLDEAKAYASNELRIGPEFLDVEVIDKKGMLIKTYTVRATVNTDPAEIGYNALKTMLADMGIEANIEMRRKSETEITYSIQTDENPLLIGKNGKTLESIQSTFVTLSVYSRMSAPLSWLTSVDTKPTGNGNWRF